MTPRLRTLAIVVAIVGLVPFVVCGIAALRVQDEPTTIRWLLALIGYGAVGLAFWGGMQWNSALAPATATDRPDGREHARLWQAVLPALIAWVALLAMTLPLYEAALAILAVGYIAALVVEVRWRRRSLLPAASMWLRWAMTIVIVVVLVTVLALRLLGAKIIF